MSARPHYDAVGQDNDTDSLRQTHQSLAKTQQMKRIKIIGVVGLVLIVISIILVVALAHKKDPIEPIDEGPAEPESPPPPPPHEAPDPVMIATQQIITAAQGSTFGYERLTYMCDTFGNRLSGSQALENTIQWAAQQMIADGLENVQIEPTNVTKWVRGNESAWLVQPSQVARNLPMLGLGNSIGTPPEGITAEVIVINDWTDLAAKNASGLVKGKIVVYNVPFTSYGATVQYRVNGAVMAATCGAVASIVRSVTPYSLKTPHTGVMTTASIPGAALTIEDTLYLARQYANNITCVITLFMQAQILPDLYPSANVIGQITGSVYPNEYVVLGGHIDSWDVGQGAQDDGGGIIASWEAVRLIKTLGLKPQRTIRVVLWTNEENGGAGGDQYLKDHIAEVPNITLAIEDDDGTFPPAGFGFGGSAAALAIMQGWLPYLKPTGLTWINAGGGGADIEPLMNAGVPGAGLDVEGTYFVYHHTQADTIDHVAVADLQSCTAAMAVLAYAASEYPTLLPR